VRIVLGTLMTALGKPQPNNGKLEVRGDDRVIVTYTDAHTADKQFDRPITREVQVVGDGIVQVMDGAFKENLRGVVLDRGVNVQITDADRDLTDAADKVSAVIEVYREKTPEEFEAETVAAQAASAVKPDAAAPAEAKSGEGEEQVSRFKLIDRLEVELAEAKLAHPEAAVSQTVDAASSANPPAPPGSGTAPAEEPDTSIHSGVFRLIVPLANAEQPVAGDDTLQAIPGDLIQVTYQDDRNRGDDARQIITKVRCVEGNLGGVRVTRAQISDQELRVKTQLKTAEALTNIGNRYKEFGLQRNATDKYEQALQVCEDISEEAARLGGRLLEETYVQLWHIYYEMDRLELAAAMSQRLQREFPNSEFVDDALLKLADVSRKQGDLQRAIGIYSRLVEMPTSQLRGEAQYGIAECYELMAKAATGSAAAQLLDRAFQEYKKVFDSFPESGRVGEAVAKMADHYYKQKDYARAIDTFETVLADHPDAKFLDVILFNYGRCLYRMDRKPDARRQFDQLISEYPESPLAADAKKISEALSKAGF
jgi:tetratricopeptide (TPR) repeat protein